MQNRKLVSLWGQWEAECTMTLCRFTRKLVSPAEPSPVYSTRCNSAVARSKRWKGRDDRRLSLSSSSSNSDTSASRWHVTLPASRALLHSHLYFSLSAGHVRIRKRVNWRSELCGWKPRPVGLVYTQEVLPVWLSKPFPLGLEDAASTKEVADFSTLFSDPGAVPVSCCHSPERTNSFATHTASMRPIPSALRRRRLPRGLCLGLCDGDGDADLELLGDDAGVLFGDSRKLSSMLLLPNNSRRSVSARFSNQDMASSPTKDWRYILPMWGLSSVTKLQRSCKDRFWMSRASLLAIDGSWRSFASFKGNGTEQDIVRSATGSWSKRARSFRVSCKASRASVIVSEAPFSSAIRKASSWISYCRFSCDVIDDKLIVDIPDSSHLIFESHVTHQL